MRSFFLDRFIKPGLINRMPGKQADHRTRTSLSIDAELLEFVDKEVEGSEVKTSRSEIISAALIDYLGLEKKETFRKVAGPSAYQIAPRNKAR